MNIKNVIGGTAVFKGLDVILQCLIITLSLLIKHIQRIYYHYIKAFIIKFREEKNLKEYKIDHYVPDNFNL